MDIISNGATGHPEGMGQMEFFAPSHRAVELGQPRSLGKSAAALATE